MESLLSLPRADVPQLAAGAGPTSAEATELSEDQVLSFTSGLIAEISRALERVPGAAPVEGTGAADPGRNADVLVVGERQPADAARQDLPRETVSLAVSGVPLAASVSTSTNVAHAGTGAKSALVAAPTPRDLPRPGTGRADVAPPASDTQLPEVRLGADVESLAVRIPTRGGGVESALQSAVAGAIAPQSRAAAAAEQYATESRSLAEFQSVGSAPEAQRALPSSGIVRGGPLDIQQPRAFGDGLVNQVTMLIGGHASQARLAITPPELGPVDVRVTVAGDDISVQLAAAQPAAREALEAALPRLRGALQDAGLQLADSGVFEQLPQQQQGTRDDARTAPGAGTMQAGDADVVAAPEPSVPRVHIGLVDAFV